MAKRKGVLLINLGSPDEPTAPAVRRYLNEFLTDPYVIDIPAPFRQMLVYGLISPRRAPNSAHAYRKVWRKEGSPLVHYTRSFSEKVAGTLKDKYEVRWAMRYGQPSLAQVCAGWDVEEILVIPLYPQYAESSTRTALEAARKILPSHIQVKTLEDFYSRTEFIQTQAEIIQSELDSFQPDHLLLSFHGLPEHHMSKLHPSHCFSSAACCDTISPQNSKCYRAQSMFTARALTKDLSFPSEKITVSFQSRLGRRPWIKPYTDIVIDELVAKGVRKLAVACPSFVADCLETLEEIQMRLREQFVTAGGEQLKLIPSLNDNAVWVQRFSKMVESFHESPNA
jgi:ferrochelatase